MSAISPGENEEGETESRKAARPFAALSRTVARSPVVLNILPFRIGPGRDGVVLIKESSIELYSLRWTAESDYQFQLMHRTPTFCKVVSSTIIPYTVLPSSSVTVTEPSDTVNNAPPLTFEPLSPQYSTSPMHIDHPMPSFQQRSPPTLRPGLTTPSSQKGSDTLVLVTQDRHALFVTCGAQDEFLIVKNIELRDIMGTLTYDKGLHISESDIERKRYREHDPDENYEQSGDDDEYSDSDMSSGSDTDSTVEDIASRIKALGKSIHADRL
ncbi:hypothetical protein V1525DRAFT_442642 [Lipomyces kononenkoae]|uniref:Uncharacterized protein n=1 Tax=Lipomyces kononenkoae TaxID=34357 RepID=A0ACC3T179_LIPKO